MFRKVLVALDGSKASNKATDWAIQAYTESKNTEFTLLYVHPVPVHLVAVEPYSGGFSYVSAPEEADVPKDTPASLAWEKFPDQERVSQLTLVGPAADTILQEASKGGYDAIVLGSEGHGVVESVLIGSVSSKVLHYATCSVLIVR